MVTARGTPKGLRKVCRKGSRRESGPMGLGRAVPVGEMSCTSRRFSVCALIASAALVSSCSGVAAPSSTTDPVGTSVASTTTASPTSTVPQIDPSDEALAVWEAFWSAWADVRAAAEPSSDPLESVATSAVIEDVVAVIERQHGVSGPVDTTITSSPTVTVQSESEVTVQDCVLMEPSMTDTVGIWYEGVVGDDGSGWKVSSLHIVETSGCVPAGMASDAIEGYEAYYEAIPEFWNPPDPDHPILSDLLAEPRLSGIKEVLAEHAQRGVTLRSQPTTHPEIIEVRSSTEVVVLDCYEPGPDDGVYDIASGERLQDEPVVRPGQRNLRSAVMVFDDGRWKASDFQGQVDHECEFAPTDLGLPSV